MYFCIPIFTFKVKLLYNRSYFFKGLIVNDDNAIAFAQRLTQDMLNRINVVRPENNGEYIEESYFINPELDHEFASEFSAAVFGAGEPPNP